MKFPVFLLFYSSLASLEVRPWFGDAWEFYFNTSYTYSSYSRVQDSIPSSRYKSCDQIVTLDLSVSPLESWAFELELETARTRAHSWTPRSIGSQAGYLWLNDLVGDPVSLVLGLNVRYVTHAGLHDVSFPYHASLQGETFISVGKEWAQGPDWVYHAFIWGALGSGTRGSPWVHALAGFESNKAGFHTFGFFIDALAGCGHHEQVPLHHFPGYGGIRHRSLDIKAQYAIDFDIWGRFDLAYSYRVYARSFPEHLQSFTLSYELPFSFF